MYDVDKLNILTPQLFGDKIAGYNYNSHTYQKDFSKLTDKEKTLKNTDFKEAYYRNAIYYALQEAITTRNQEHMFTPINQDTIKEASTHSNNAEHRNYSSTNGLLVPDSDKFSQSVGIGRIGTGAFAQTAKATGYAKGLTLTKPLQFTVPNVLADKKAVEEDKNISSKEFNEISISNNLDTIDAYINSSIDNLKNLDLGKLLINTNSLPFVAGLLFLGETDSKFIFSFINKYGLNKLTKAKAAERYKDDKDFMYLMDIMEEQSKLTKALNVVRQYPTTYDDLEDQIGMLEDLLDNTSTNIFSNPEIIKNKNAQLAQFLNSYKHVRTLMQTAFPLHSTEKQELYESFYKESNLRFSNGSIQEINELIFNYVFTGKLLGTTNPEKLVKDTVKKYDELPASIKSDLIYKIIATRTNEGKEELRSYFGRLDPIMLAYYENIFSKFPAQLQKDMAVVSSLEGNNAFSTKSYSSIIPTNTLKQPFVDDKSYIDIAKEADEITKERLDEYNTHLALTLAHQLAKSEYTNFRSLNEVKFDTTQTEAINKQTKAIAKLKKSLETETDEAKKEDIQGKIDKAYNKLKETKTKHFNELFNKEPEQTSYIKDAVTETIAPTVTKGVRHITVNGKDIYYDLPLTINLANIRKSIIENSFDSPKKSEEEKADKIDARIEKKMLDIIANPDTVFPKIYSTKNNTYVRVHLADSEAYYQKLPNKYINYGSIADYNIDEYFNGDYYTEIPSSYNGVDEINIKLKYFVGNNIYAYKAGNISREQRFPLIFKGTTQDTRIAKEKVGNDWVEKEVTETVYLYGNVKKRVETITEDEVSESLIETVATLQGNNSVTEVIEALNPRPISEISIKEINGKFHLGNLVSPTKQGILDEIKLNEYKAKFRGQLHEKLVLIHAFNLNYDLNEVYKEYANKLPAGEIAQIIDGAKFLETEETAKRIKKFLRFEEGDKLVGVDSTGKIIEDPLARRFNDSGLELTGEIDLLVRHADGSYTLADLKASSKLQQLMPNFQKKTYYGSNLYETFDTSMKSSGKLQIGIYAMLLKKNNPDMNFRDILLVPIYNEDTLDTRKETLRANMPGVISVMKALYKDLNKSLPESILDPYTYNRPTKVTTPIQENIDILILNMNSHESKINALKGLPEKAQDLEVEKAALKDALEQYKDLTNNSKLINTHEGLNPLTMWITTMRGTSNTHIAKFQSAFEAAQQNATKEKEELYAKFKVFLNKYLTSEGNLNTLVDSGNYDVYRKLFTINSTGQVKFKPVETLHSKEAKDLVTFMNKVYKDIFTEFNNDKVHVNPFNPGGDLLSSFDYHRLVLKDNIEYYEGWIPKTAKTFGEFTRGTLLNGRVKDWFRHVYNKYLSYYNETNFERTNWADRMPIQIKFANEAMNNEEHISFDLESQFDLFTSWSIHKKHMIAPHAIGKAINVSLEYAKEPDLKNVVQYIDRMIDMNIKGVKQGDIVIQNNNYERLGNLNKIMWLLGSFVSKLILSLNLIGGLRNAAQIVSSYVKHMVKDKFIDSKGKGMVKIDPMSTGAGVRKGTLAMVGRDEKMMAMFRQFGVSSRYNMLSVSNHRKSLGRGANLFGKSFTAFYSVPEELMAMGLMYDYLVNTKHNGKSLYDWYEYNDGVLEWKGGTRGVNAQGEKIEGLTSLEISKLKYSTELINGPYRRDERVLLDYSLIGSMFLAFKRTLLGNTRNFFKGKQTLESLGKYETIDGIMQWQAGQTEGTLSLMAGLIAGKLNWKGYEQYKWGKTTVEQKAKFYEAMAGVVLAVLLFMAGVGGPDDEKDDNTKRGWEWAFDKMNNNIPYDLITSVFPIDFLSNWSPTSFAYLNNVADSGFEFAVNSFRGELLGMEEAYNQEGYVKGGIQFYKLLPILKNFTKDIKRGHIKDSAVMDFFIGEE